MGRSYVGIDPGTQGAFCLLDSNGVHFCDTPSNKNLHASMRQAYKWFSEMSSFCVGIEDVHSMGGMSAKSNFQFGRNLGFVETLAHLSSPTVEYVQPKVWQKACGIEFIYSEGMSPAQKSVLRKQTVAATAQLIYPDAELYGARGGLKDGRADALMIAHFLRLKYGRPI